MRILISIFFLLFSLNIFSQNSSRFLDVRDSTWYATVEVGRNTWFQENLRFETDGCFCKKRKKKKALCKITNYYPYKELGEVCPAGWHVATLKDWESFVEVVKQDHEMDLSLIEYDTIENGSIIINSDEFKFMGEQTILNFQKIGWVQGRRIQQKQNTTLWINDESIEDDRYHVHYGDTGYVKHTHRHNMDGKKRLRRRFSVRCVQEVSK